MLGPLEVVGEDGPVRLGGPRQRATLAILLLHANRVVSIERLADDLYAGSPPVTAVTQVQRQVSELRKALGSDSVIETRAPGYVLRLASEQLDLGRFEQQAAAGTAALAGGEPEAASELLAAALALWHGSPLADLADEPFARPAIERLEEMYLVALERRVDADLALGRHTELVGELEQLASEHPFREPFARQLMLALYRSGRQVEALDVYRRTREVLARELGLDPGPALRRLEQAVLLQEASLDVGEDATAAPAGRTVLVVPSRDERLADLVAICRPLVGRPGHELILARLLDDGSELRSANAALNAQRTSLAVDARTAVFTSDDPALDVVRLATNYDVELALLDSPVELGAVPLPSGLAAILERSPADVAVLAGAVEDPIAGGELFVPFGGSEHDWAALELAALMCSSAGARMTLLGTTAHGGRDASRLLADASLAVQRVVGVETESQLVDPTEEALSRAVEPATLVVMGIATRWQAEGIGNARRAFVQTQGPPLLFVHRGLRPGGLSPAGRDTRFTWSIDADAE